VTGANCYEVDPRAFSTLSCVVGLGLQRNKELLSNLGTKR